MHRIPQFFNHSKSSTSSKHRRTASAKPKLKRSNAARHIDYEAPSTSSSDQSSSALRARSLGILPSNDRTSFRVEGNEGELEVICRRLGLSGPEEFEIPAAAWEAMKSRSSSDVLPLSGELRFDSLNVEVQVENEGPSENLDGVLDSLRACNVNDLQIEVVPLNDCKPVGGDGDDADELVNSLEDSVRVSSLIVNKNELVETAGSGIRVQHSNGGRGIKGDRPPTLEPPPSMLLPVIDNGCSTWDLLRSFAPGSDIISGFEIHGGIASDDEQDEGNEESGNRDGEHNDVRVGGPCVLYESCSFTTSNDDDSSSTTTDPASNNISPNVRSKRNITDWEKGELLGRGTFGSVYEGIDDGGFFFAVKEVSLLDQGELGRQSIHQLEQEIALLSQFEHENIVQYYGTDKAESKLFIFLELVPKGSLLRLYQKYTLRDSQVSSYTRQILHGLKYLHDRKVVHRDIKCANILVHTTGSVKLADFGLAKATKLNDIKSCQGTAFWMAPEVVNRKNQGYGLAADIWSLGCTVLEMLTRQLPYSPLECMQALFKIGGGIPPPVPDSLSTDARDFILQCLRVNPAARPTADQLLGHPFVNKPLSSSLAFASPLDPRRRV